MGATPPLWDHIIHPCTLQPPGSLQSGSARRRRAQPRCPSSRILGTQVNTGHGSTARPGSRAVAPWAAQTCSGGSGWDRTRALAVASILMHRPLRCLRRRRSGARPPPPTSSGCWPGRVRAASGPDPGLHPPKKTTEGPARAASPRTGRTGRAPSDSSLSLPTQPPPAILSHPSRRANGGWRRARARHDARRMLAPRRVRTAGESPPAARAGQRVVKVRCEQSFVL